MKRPSKAVLCAVISAIILTSSMSGIIFKALADTTITQAEAYGEAVELYENLTGASVDVPQDMLQSGLDGDMLKSVALGYMNAQECEDVMNAASISKQDYMTVLYKTIVRYDDSFAIYEDEANSILNECYDNAEIDEENRIAYAFMIKQGILRTKTGTEPESELTKEECEAFTDTAYSFFAKDVTMQIGDRTVTSGERVDDVIERFGMPNRIDETEYGFDWYVYNADYGEFCMIGIQADRVFAMFTNCPDFEYNGIRRGDDYAKTEVYSSDRRLRFYRDSDGYVDSVLYNPSYRELVDNASIKRSKALILLDLINSNRNANGKPIYAEDADMTSDTWLAALKDGKSDEIDGTLTTQAAYDVFSAYRQLVEKDDSIITQDTNFSTPVGITVSTDEDGTVHANILSDTERLAGTGGITVAEIEEKDFTVNGVEEVTTPVLTSFSEDNAYIGNEDIVIELEMQASDEYHVEVFDFEHDRYAVNAYIVTDDTRITLPAELFKAGSDYSLIVSSITPDGEALSADEVLISYGSAYDSGVEILTPYNTGSTDDDYIAMSWKSEQYHDFCIELYNEHDELVVTKTVENEYEAVIQGVNPGKYNLVITALRRGTKIEKARDIASFDILKAEPVMNEIILDRDDTYYFVYEDEELGLLYFYEEEIIDAEENGEPVKKKKIIQKQVKATKGYRELDKYRTKPDYTTGEPVIRSFMLSGDSAKGSAILAEAQKYLGVPYVWGGTTPDGFDCSGLVQYVCSSLGISVNRVAEDQFKNGMPVSRDQLQPGDLVFFEQNGYIHHVGIYAGDGMMLHAPRTGEVVQYQSIDTDYYRSEYAGARRVY